jgi:short-subunit dehydrogenase
MSPTTPNAPLGTALITGASTGLGAIYARKLAQRGYDLILVARDQSRMEALAATLRAETGRAIDVLPADLTNPAELANIGQRLRDDATITLLVNNAGIAMDNGLLDSEPAAIERLIALNITAPSLLAAAAGKAFVARGKGGLINISSVLALAPEQFEGAYSGSKAYILNLTLSLAAQLKNAGVHAQAVLPGATRTEIWARSGKDVDALPAEMVMEAEDLVDAALLGFDRGEVVTIPPLQDEGQWQTLEAARLAMAPHLSRREVAPRYKA